MSDRRVVVTGLGTVSPLGVRTQCFWDALVSGRCGIGPIRRFDASPFDVQIGGECRDFDPSAVLNHRQIKRMDRFAQMAMVAAIEAFEHAGLTPDHYDPLRAGVIMGTGIGGLGEIEDQHLRLLHKGPGRVSAFTIPKLMANAAAGHIAIRWNLQGVTTSVATACASATSAMGDAYHAIRRGLVDVVVTGGAEAALTPLGLGAFAAMKALSQRNDEPLRASRPFDKDRDGFVLSEGAGILIFEEYEHARQRGAEILCEVAGYGTSTDAEDMVQPGPDGRGAALAMAAALRDARVAPEDVDYINAHGTSTPLGDIAETKAIKRVFGEAARRVAISSTKGATGHALGASGGLEAVAAICALRHNVIPPTINLDEPDPECDLDYSPHTARDARLNVVMSNSFGFGGHNTCIVFRRV